jgi:hypothetical protein
MLENKGKKTIHVHASTNVTKQVMLAVTIGASGKMLPPMLIFKGTPNGCIANHEFGMYPDCLGCIQIVATTIMPGRHGWMRA